LGAPGRNWGLPAAAAITIAIAADATANGVVEILLVTRSFSLFAARVGFSLGALFPLGKKRNESIFE